MDEEMRRAANRMVGMTIMGLMGGAAHAVRRGLPIARTAVLVGANGALIGTSCFGLERFANVALRQAGMTDDLSRYTAANRLYASHAIGGAGGGALLGYLYHFRVLPGILLFTPLMLLVAHGEIEFERARYQRIQKFLEESGQIK